MPINDLQNNKPEERKTLASGTRWPRFIFAVVGFFILVEIVSEPGEFLIKLFLLMLCGIFYFVFYRIRRLQFDNDNLYILKGKDETVVPFVSIISIKKANTKVNGQRYYKILYKDEFNTEHIRRYMPGIFGESKNFIATVKKANPDVVHWSHPFFNH